MERASQQSFLECVRRPNRLFCDLGADTREAFHGITSVIQYREGTTLFREGQRAGGVFVLGEGRVKLSVVSESGKHLILRVAGAGEVLGLRASLVGGPHEVTAEALDNIRVGVVKNKDLLRFLHDHRQTCLQVVNLLSQDLHVAYDGLRSIGLGRNRRPRGVPVN